ncbi:MAG: hypothetical protein AB8B49_00385 [Nitratireductor sp.]
MNANEDAVRKKIFYKAYNLLMEKGYSELELSDVAKSISMKNKYFHELYKDKQSLIKAMLDMNLQPMRMVAKQSMLQNEIASITLHKYALEVLKFVNSKKAISISRLSCSLNDEERAFGKLVNQHCRASMLEYIMPVVQNAIVAGWLAHVKADYADDLEASAYDIVQFFLNSLLGDVQMRLASGALEKMATEEIHTKSQHSVELVYVIYGA